MNNTLQMPWDNLMNFSYYKLFYVKIIKTIVKIIKEKEEINNKTYLNYKNKEETDGN